MQLRLEIELITSYSLLTRGTTVCYDLAEIVQFTCQQIGIQFTFPTVLVQ
jgi:hypothetical protein